MIADGTASQTSQTVEWLDKHQAAERLGKSWRTVLTLAQEGKIQSRKEKDHATGQMVVKLHAGDIERLCYERDHPETTAVAALPKVAVGKAKQAPASPAEPATTASKRPWLTLDEAAEYSGLRKSWLLDFAMQNLPATLEGIGISVRDNGPGPGGRWRFHRGSLRKP